MDVPINLRSLQGDLYRTAKDKGWYSSKDTFDSLLLMMHSELTEIVNETRMGEEKTNLYFVRDENDVMKPCGVPIEIADLIIRALNLMTHYGLDAGYYIQLKDDYNKTRTHRHGGKRL